MIKLETFLSKVREIESEKPTYKRGHDGRNGLCDCIGLVMGGVRRSGGKWTGAHGSNYGARYKMATLLQSPALEIGMILYKAYKPGEPGYNLPATYANHPDKNDYYHAGIVMRVNPLEIKHCTSWSGGSGIKTDTAIGKWKYGGRLKGMDYDIKEGPILADIPATTGGIGIVTATTGKTVRLRAKPYKTAVILEKVPIDAAVRILSEEGSWLQVQHQGKTGWMMKEFVRKSQVAVDARTDLTLEQKVDILWAEHLVRVT